MVTVAMVEAAFSAVSLAGLKDLIIRSKAEMPRSQIAAFLFLGAPDVPSLNRSQIVTGSQKHRDPKFSPYAFTEHGILMLSSVLNSERAIQVNIEIMRSFVRLRVMLASNAELSRKLDHLESKYDRQFKAVFDAIRQLMSLPVRDRKQIGFR